MRNFRKLTCLIIAAFLAGSCSMNKSMSGSNIIVTPLSDKATLSDGSLIYALPLTVLDIEIEAERVIEKPGPYSRFAGDLLGLADIIRSENEYWSISRIVVKTHQELDPAHFYVIEASSFFGSNVLALKKSGLIMDINPEAYNTFQGISPDGETDFSHLRVYDLGSDEYFENRRDTLYRVVSIDTTFVRIPYLIEKKQKLTIDNLAEKAAVRLMELRDGKHLILTGEANVFPQNEAAINELNRLEKEYTELFTGKTLKEKRTFNYQLIPGKDLAGKQVTICMFSELTGPGSTAEKSGTPLIMKFIPELKARNLNILSSRSGSSQSQKYDKLYYRVPDVVNLEVSIGNEVFNTSRQLIYQFGEVIPLPSNYLIGK